MGNDPTEEIRSRVDLVDLISAHVRLVRSGRTFKGLCPFHQEKTPSFVVSPERQWWHCFGCGEHGDCFGFLMKIEALSFPEALRRLAEKTGVQIRERHQRQDAGEREQMLQALSAAQRHFRESLSASAPAQEYLTGRQVDPKTAETFGIGYASDGWDNLVRFFVKEKVDLAAAAKAGLVGRRRDGGYYDRFRKRLMFPVWDSSDRLVGFGGRDLGDEGPKYFNSPETPLFRKGDILYGLGMARKAIASAGYAVLVEGYLDVISAHRAGVQVAVAPMGTALGQGHVRLLKRLCERAVIAFDSDEAGQKAAGLASEVLQPAGFDVKIAPLPAGEDPDSLVTSGRSAELLGAVEGAIPAAEHALSRLMAGFDLSDERDKARMLQQASRLLAGVPNAFERDRLIGTLAPFHPSFQRSAEGAEQRIRQEVDRAARSSGSARPSRESAGRDSGANRESPERRPVTALDKAEQLLLRVLVEGNEHAGYVMQEVPADRFMAATSRDLAGEIYQMRTIGDGFSMPALEELGADDEVLGLASTLMVLDDDPPPTRAAIDDCIRLIRSEGDRRRLVGLQEKVKKNELTRTDPEYEEYLELMRARHG